jgi:conserved domain protein
MHLGGEDEERILAFSFLRFREETGMPFRLGNVVEDTKAAGGAAERIALYCPLWAILTVVRTDEEKYMESALTRGVLSTWSQENADECCQFYMDAVLRTEAELNEIKTHWANTFATRTARILLTTLSELCSKCSDKMMAQLLVFLKKLYDSPQKEHYLKAAPLVRRLISFYPVALRHDLVMQLLTFPLPDLKRLNVQLDFPDPFEVLSASASGYESNSDRSYKEVEQLIALIQRNDEDLSALNRLLYCGAHGLLTTEQKKWLGGFIWKNGEPHLPPYWLDTVCLKLPSQYEVEEVRYLCQSITNKIAQNTSGAIRFPGGDAVFTELINVSLPHADDFTPEETSAILEYSNKRITALSENINREVDIFGDKGMFVSQIYQILHALWIFTTLRSQWTPTEKDCAVMLAIITQCDSHHISHHGIKRYWSIFLKQNFESKKDLEHSLRSADTKRAHSCYNVLATTICNPDKRLLPDDELCIGLGVAAQQIAWGVPKQLVSALQTVSHAVQYRSDLLTMQSMELILTGLSQLVEQTRISSDDTVATASEKGDIRRWAVILATKIDAGKISKDGQEILKDWRAVSQDKDEFVEIRNGQR